MAKKKLRRVGVYFKDGTIIWLQLSGRLTDKLVEEKIEEYKNTEVGKAAKDKEIGFWVEV